MMGRVTKSKVGLGKNIVVLQSALQELKPWRAQAYLNYCWDKSKALNTYMEQLSGLWWPDQLIIIDNGAYYEPSVWRVWANVSWQVPAPAATAPLQSPVIFNIHLQLFRHLGALPTTTVQPCHNNVGLQRRGEKIVCHFGRSQAGEIQ